MKKLPENIGNALVPFIENVNGLIVDYWRKMNFTHNMPPAVFVENVGKRYARLALCNFVGGKWKPSSVYCFVDIENGDLLKGSWKAPVKNGVRGNLFDPDVISKFNEHGPKYLR